MGRGFQQAHKKGRGKHVAGASSIHFTHFRRTEAPSYGLPISAYAPASVGAKAYVALALEFLKGDEKEL